MMSVIEKFCKDCDIIPDYKLESGFKIRMGVATYKKRAQELAEFSRLVLEVCLHLRHKSYFTAFIVYPILSVELYILTKIRELYR